MMETTSATGTREEASIDHASEASGEGAGAAPGRLAMAGGAAPSSDRAARPIEVTAEAFRQARRLRAKEGHPEGAFLRVGVKGGGCSGFAYVLKFDTAERPGDLVLTGEDFKVVVDPKSLPYLEGMVLDFAGGLMGQGLVIKNPNAKSNCGCGKSFGV
jgi:iron-sulfur cluster assembly protein